MKYAKAVLLAVSQVVSCPHYLFSADAPIASDSSRETLTNGEEQKPASIYNDAKVIFHAIGSKFHSDLEGIDPGKSIEVMETTLSQFVEQNPDVPQEMRDRISKMQKSLASAKTNYWNCIRLVSLSGEQKVVSEMALQLSQDAKSLADDPSCPSILFMGGHYIHPKGKSLGGHTASYEVIRQDNGKLSFIINDTAKVGKYSGINGNRIRQLVYTDLEPADLDFNFWTHVILKNYMNPVPRAELMDSFYLYVDTKLLKSPNNKMRGRSFRRQELVGEFEVGVCAWKSISVWLHGKISPGDFSENRDSFNEIIYLRFKKFMFENMLANFNPDNSFKAKIRMGEDSKDAIPFLKTELERKIQKMDAKAIKAAAKKVLK
jgi:hypothetical protein